MSAKLLAVVFFLGLAGHASALTLYVGPDRLKDQPAVCTLAPGPGGTLIGTGVYSGVTMNVILTPKAGGGFDANIIIDDGISVGTGGGLMGPSGGGTGDGVIKVKGYTAGRSFSFTIR